MATPDPDSFRMCLHALWILEEPIGRATLDPIEPTAAIRLALAWLVKAGIAQLWQVQNYWDTLTKPCPVKDAYQASYIRFTDMNCLLEAWKMAVKQRRAAALGLEPYQIVLPKFCRERPAPGPDGAAA